LSVVRRLLLRNRRIWAVVRDSVSGLWRYGGVHAGNLAYLSLLALFPFFIMIGAIAGSMGRTDYGYRAVRGFLKTLPPEVATLVAKPIEDVIANRASSGLLTFGIIVTLWTVSGFIENLRVIIREAYGTATMVPPWRYRLGALLLVFVAVLVMIAAFAAEVLLTSVDSVVLEYVPMAAQTVGRSALSQLLPALALFLALYATFYALTPKRHRIIGDPIWPGPLVTTIVWIGTTRLMPLALGLFGSYSRTYGSLAGVAVTLLFFWIIGLGLVFGAHLNASLAKARQRRLKGGQTILSGTA
jgi:membrane protein